MSTNPQPDNAPITWKTLLSRYIEQYGRNKSPEELEEETTLLFLEDIKQNTFYSSTTPNLPKFFL